MDAFDVFAQAVAVATAHEIGHMLGLSAPGPAPAGHLGGTTGTLANHNVTLEGRASPGNFVMNAGRTFSLASLTGRGGHPLPRFRALSWAYLRNRIVRSDRIVSLDPPPFLSEVEIRLDAAAPRPLLVLELHGMHLSEHAEVALVGRTDGALLPIVDVEGLGRRRLRARIVRTLVPAGRYDILVLNPDDQTARLEGALTLPLASGR